MGIYIIYLFFTVIGLSVAISIYHFVLACVYDIRYLRWIQKMKMNPNSSQLRLRPLISIVVYAKNDHQFLPDCITSIVNNGYKKVEVIIVDNMSQDHTSVIAKDLATKHGNKVRVVTKKSASSRQEAISYSAKKWASGEYIITVDAATTLEKGGLHRIVRHLSDTGTSAVLANVRRHHQDNFWRIKDVFSEVLSLWTKKSGKKLYAPSSSYNNVAAYRRDTFQQISKPARSNSINNVNDLYGVLPASQIMFASDVVANFYKKRPTPSNSTKLRKLPKFGMAKILLFSLEPILASFMLYIALKHDSPNYFLLGWGVYTSLLFLAIWSDESQKITSKISLSLMSPIGYYLNILTIPSLIFLQFITGPGRVLPMPRSLLSQQISVDQKVTTI